MSGSIISGRNNLIALEVIYKFQTAKAVKIETLDGFDDDIWIPKSQIAYNVSYQMLEKGEHFIIHIDSDYAQEKGLV